MYVGLLFAVLTGLTWVITGAIVGLAERRGCGAFRQQLVSTLYSIAAVSVALVAGGRLFPDAAAFAFSAARTPSLLMVAWGFLNFWMIFFMGRAMARGPNGLAWTVTQSGLVFPFLMGVLTGRTELTWFRAAGLVLGLLTVLSALYLNFFAARTRQARLCCCLMLYFGIGIIVTGVSGI